MENAFREIEGDALEEIILKPLNNALTLMNKYSVLPIYFMQFIVDKATLLPIITLTAYDDRDMVLSMANSVNHMCDIIYNKTPSTITPSVIVYPNNMDRNDVLYNTSEKYYYSSVYVICGKELKIALSKNKLQILKVKIQCDKYMRSAKTIIAWKTNADTEEEANELENNIMLYPISDNIRLIKLPLINICSKIQSVKPILESVINPNNEPAVWYGKDLELSNIVTDIKDEIMCSFKNSDIKIFKDFIKQKPDTLYLWKSENVKDKQNIVSVAADMVFNKTKYNSLILYRYIDNIYDSLSARG